MRHSEIDFTRGSIFKNMVRFSLPFLAANLLQALYGVADMMVVGRVAGPSGVAAVQVGGQMVTLITNIAMGLAVAATVLVAQYAGAGKHDEQNKVIGTMMTLFLLLSSAATVLIVVFKDGILHLLNTPDEVLHSAGQYLCVSAVGMVFVFGYHLIGAVLRGSGDAKRPLMFASVSIALNIALDLLFVWGMGIGPIGAAAATVISQGIGCLLGIYYCKKAKIFDFRFSSFRINRHTLGQVLRVGVPSGIQFSVTGLSFLALTGLSNRLAGAAGSTVLGIGTRINSFGILPCMALSSAVTAVAGQNLGAGQAKRAGRAFWMGAAIALGFSMLIFAAVNVWPEPLIRLFFSMKGNGDSEMAQQCISLGRNYLRLISFDYLFAAVFFCANGLANGAGQTWFTLLNSAINAFAVRLPLAYLLSGVWFQMFDYGMNGIGAAIGFAPVLSVTLGLLYVFSGHWKKGKLAGDIAQQRGQSKAGGKPKG